MRDERVERPVTQLVATLAQGRRLLSDAEAEHARLSTFERELTRQTKEALAAGDRATAGERVLELKKVQKSLEESAGTVARLRDTCERAERALGPRERLRLLAARGLLTPEELALAEKKLEQSG
jgi:hypothetical protein